MKTSPLAMALALVCLLADPAMAQTRMKDDSRRSTPRETSTTTDRNERRNNRDSETARPQPIRQTVTAPRPRPDDRDRYDRRDRWDTRWPVIILGSGYGRGATYGSGTYGYGGAYGHDYRSGRVWDRDGRGGMTCLRLDDELEWAHDEWHYRNDRQRNERWYEAEHARLEWRIAEERLYSSCGRALDDRDCRDRGHYARSGESLEIALLVLDILLGDARRSGY